MRARLVVLALLLAATLVALAPSGQAKVINENTDDLPPGCEEVATDEAITVRGGREHALAFPGAVFTFDERSWSFEPCTRVNVTFVNDDDIRHQFMVHGAWPNGLFQIEIDGPGQESGTFIVGSRPDTLLVHCGVAQHQQKGMKAQFLVAGGEGDLPNLLGISGIPEDPGHGPQTTQGTPDGERPIPAPGVLVASLSLVAAGLVVRRLRP